MVFRKDKHFLEVGTCKDCGGKVRLEWSSKNQMSQYYCEDCGRLEHYNFGASKSRMNEVQGIFTMIADNLISSGIEHPELTIVTKITMLQLGLSTIHIKNITSWGFTIINGKLHKTANTGK